ERDRIPRNRFLRSGVSWPPPSRRNTFLSPPARAGQSAEHIHARCAASADAEIAPALRAASSTSNRDNGPRLCKGRRTAYDEAACGVISCIQAIARTAKSAKD